MRSRSLPILDFVRIAGKENVLTSPEERCCYSYDASKLKALPDCVVLPGTAEEVAALVKLANRDHFSVFPRGAGSGMVGASIPVGGGLVISLNRLNRILEVDSDNMTAVVEPGVVTGDFQKRVLQHGLFYPPDPASLPFSTLGGNVAMCAGGPRAVKYGVTRDYVLGLEVVLPTGNLIRTGTRTMKGVVGYDLTRLLVGSEGTLGIFTKIILRLLPAPEGVRTLVAIFPRIDDAARAVCTIIRNRIIPSTLELLDQATLQAVENYLHMGLPIKCEALLLIEVDGRDKLLDDDVGRIETICREAEASETEIAATPSDRERLWQARRAISPALGQIRPGKINEDVTVPRTQIPALIRAIRSLAEKYRLVIVCFGHAGDGNIHTNIMLDRKDRDELSRAEQAVHELFRTVLDLGGTLSGEHGIGITKSPFLQWEVGAEGFEAMWKIKHALDPLNILNPGKMFVSNRAFFRG
ncbi:FAD-binding oxidoreductase [Desulforhabdus sp. TSK]|uniref:FAD-binding oxidoreductase n=1 Tax=Desulforhabdus sp. TSK TaxID=2925014 RepID=UPI00208236BB|nr:FAD-binding protein [Desulforhabdus sp. TSK]